MTDVIRIANPSHLSQRLELVVDLSEGSSLKGTQRVKGFGAAQG